MHNIGFLVLQTLKFFKQKNPNDAPYTQIRETKLLLIAIKMNGVTKCHTKVQLSTLKCQHLGSLV